MHFALRCNIEVDARAACIHHRLPQVWSAWIFSRSVTFAIHSRIIGLNGKDCDISPVRCGGSQTGLALILRPGFSFSRSVILHERITPVAHRRIIGLDVFRRCAINIRDDFRGSDSRLLIGLGARFRLFTGKMVLFCEKRSRFEECARALRRGQGSGFGVVKIERLRLPFL